MLVPADYLPFVSPAIEDAISGSVIPLDKLAHAILYCGLVVLASMAYGLGPAGIRHRWLFVGGAAHGALIEILQSWIPTRSGDLFDLAADVGGLAIGLCLVAAFRWLTVTRG